jgi:hypothetical protein
MVRGLLSEVHFGGNFSHSSHLPIFLLTQLGQYCFGTHLHRFFRCSHASQSLPVPQVLLWTFAAMDLWLLARIAQDALDADLASCNILANLTFWLWTLQVQAGRRPESSLF